MISKASSRLEETREGMNLSPYCTLFLAGDENLRDGDCTTEAERELFVLIGDGGMEEGECARTRCSMQMKINSEVHKT